MHERFTLKKLYKIHLKIYNLSHYLIIHHIILFYYSFILLKITK